MPHQVKSLKKKLECPIGGDFSEVGTGKSLSMILALQARVERGYSKRILWVTTNTIKDETAREIEKFTTLKPTVLKGTGVEKSKILANLKGKDCLIITNYDSLQYLVEELSKMEFDSVVCDESSAIANHQTKRNKSLCKIAKKAQFRWIMTGTPVPNNVLGIFGQWKFVEPTLFSTLTEFKREYCIYVDKGFPVLVGFKNLDSLQKILFERAIRYRRDDCFDLPERTFVRREVKLGPEQKRVYKKLRDEFVAGIDSGQTVSAKGILDSLVKLSEITSGFIIDEDKNVVDLSENAKLHELDILLEELNLRETKVIIWCYFKHTIKKLQARYAEHHPAVLYGEVKAEDRIKELDKLRQNDDCRMLIAQIATSEGYTINEAPVAIYFEHDFSWKNRDQSLGRNHRYGQSRKGLVVDLVCPGTVDAAKLKALEAKKSIQDVVTGDNIRSVVDGEIS